MIADLIEENGFADRVRQIDERFKDRLSGEAIKFCEDYINNRFGIVVRLHRRGECGSQWVALCVDASCSGIGAPPMSGDQQEPMLVDIVELVKAPNKRQVIAPSFARVYNIKNERLGLWEGLIYRQVLFSGIIGTVREILPRFVSWKGRMDSISTMKRESWVKDTCGIRIIINSDNIRVVGNNLFYNLFDTADVLLGPFNLEF